MGFCRYCGEISLGKCSRCGGRSVESTISSMISDNSVSIIDKWQSQYEDTILLTKEMLSNKHPTSKRLPVTQSTFYDTIRKACVCCSKVLDHKTAAIIEDNKSYCQNCHLRLYNKGECEKCQKLVLASQKFIEYGKGVWHADCFNCFDCKMPLEQTPLVDLQNRPCCEPCFMKQAGTRKNTPPRVSLYGRDPSLFTQKATRTMLSHHLFDKPDNNPANHKTQSTPIIPSKQNTPNTKHTGSLSQRPCHYCHKPLGDATQKKVRMEAGSQQHVWFHKSCFLCSKCHKPFKDGKCATDGISFYHTQCEEYCATCDKPIQTDAFIFNHKKYHTKCFTCFASGCPIKLSDPIFEVNSKPYCQPCYSQFISQTPTKTTSRSSRLLPKLGGFNTCPRCKQSISIMDDTPGPFASHWHKKCLCCATCSKQLDSAAKMKQGSQKESLVYCRNCA